MPRWLGDNKFEWPDDAPGTSNVLWLVCGEFKFKFGRLWPKFIGCCTCNVLDVIFILVGLFWGTFLPKSPPPPAAWLAAEPSSLDNELVFSKSTETAFDSVNSTEPLNEKLDELMETKKENTRTHMSRIYLSIPPTRHFYDIIYIYMYTCGCY